MRGGLLSRFASDATSKAAPGCNPGAAFAVWHPRVKYNNRSSFPLGIRFISVVLVVCVWTASLGIYRPPAASAVVAEVIAGGAIAATLVGVGSAYIAANPGVVDLGDIASLEGASLHDVIAVSQGMQTGLALNFGAVQSEVFELADPAASWATAGGTALDWFGAIGDRIASMKVAGVWATFQACVAAADLWTDGAYMSINDLWAEWYLAGDSMVTEITAPQFTASVMPNFDTQKCSMGYVLGHSPDLTPAEIAILGASYGLDTAIHPVFESPWCYDLPPKMKLYYDNFYCNICGHNFGSPTWNGFGFLYYEDALASYFVGPIADMNAHLAAEHPDYVPLAVSQTSLEWDVGAEAPTAQALPLDVWAADSAVELPAEYAVDVPFYPPLAQPYPPYVRDVTLPLFPGSSDLAGVADTLRGAIDGWLAEDLSWLPVGFKQLVEWLLSPLSILTDALAAFIDWAAGLVGDLEALAHQFLFPNGQQLKFEFQQKYDGWKTLLKRAWPFAAIPFVSLFADMITGGAHSSPSGISSSWTIDMAGNELVIDLEDLMDPIAGYRWLLALFVHFMGVLLVVRTLRPHVKV